MWPVIVGTVGAGYCILAMYRLIRYRRSVSSILSSSSTITRARYIRLFILAIGLLVIFLPLVAYTLAYTVSYSDGYSPGPYSWSKVHPPERSTTIIRLDAVTQKRRYHRPFDRWGQIATGFILFLLFGLGHEAVTMYKAWLVRVGFAIWWPALNGRQPSASEFSSRLSGPAELGTSHSSRAP
jgi:pheromone a factor receptor